MIHYNLKTREGLPNNLTISYTDKEIRLVNQDTLQSDTIRPYKPNQNVYVVEMIAHTQPVVFETQIPVDLSLYTPKVIFKLEGGKVKTLLNTL